LVIYGPGIPAGRSDALIELHDLNPTLVELADLQRQPGIDARSFAPLLRNTNLEHREACVTCQSTYRAIRTRDYKYIETFNDQSELYDLVEDPDELTNTIGDNPETASRLGRQMRERFTEGKWLR
jgi:choline-sulfatase